MAAVNRPLVARMAVKLPKFSGATQLEPYLAQFRLVEWHNGWGDGEAVVHLALALEGTAVQALLDLAPEEQRDRRALIRALERRFGHLNWTATGRGLGSAAGHRNILDCVIGIGVVGTSDP